MATKIKYDSNLGENSDLNRSQKMEETVETNAKRLTKSKKTRRTGKIEKIGDKTSSKKSGECSKNSSEIKAESNDYSAKLGKFSLKNHEKTSKKRYSEVFMEKLREKLCEIFSPKTITKLS